MTCGKELVPKCGTIVAPYWSHKAACTDDWNEESEWHAGWKLRAPSDWCEYVMGPHRADIRLPDGRILELQRSSLSVTAIRERELFYGNLTWLFYRDVVDPDHKKPLIARTDSGRVTLNLGSSRDLKIRSVTKPLYIDFDGPILEVQEWLAAKNVAVVTVLSRRLFCERFGLDRNHASEWGGASHRLVSIRRNLQRIVPAGDELPRELEGREQSMVRLDGTMIDT